MHGTYGFMDLVHGVCVKVVHPQVKVEKVCPLSLSSCVRVCIFSSPGKSRGGNTIGWIDKLQRDLRLDWMQNPTSPSTRFVCMNMARLTLLLRFKETFTILF